MMIERVSVWPRGHVVTFLAAGEAPASHMCCLRAPLAAPRPRRFPQTARKCPPLPPRCLGTEGVSCEQRTASESCECAAAHPQNGSRHPASVSAPPCPVPGWRVSAGVPSATGDAHLKGVRCPRIQLHALLACKLHIHQLILLLRATVCDSGRLFSCVRGASFGSGSPVRTRSCQPAQRLTQRHLQSTQTTPGQGLRGAQRAQRLAVRRHCVQTVPDPSDACTGRRAHGAYRTHEGS